MWFLEKILVRFQTRGIIDFFAHLSNFDNVKTAKSPDTAFFHHVVDKTVQVRRLHIVVETFKQPPLQKLFSLKQVTLAKYAIFENPFFDFSFVSGRLMRPNSIVLPVHTGNQLIGISYDKLLISQDNLLGNLSTYHYYLSPSVFD